jgi:hypothetical protein
MTVIVVALACPPATPCVAASASPPKSIPHARTRTDTERCSSPPPSPSLAAMFGSGEIDPQTQFRGRTPSATSDRLIVPLKPASIFPGSFRVYPSSFNDIPPQLADRGVTRDEWMHWMGRLSQQVQEVSFSVVSAVLIICTLVAIPYLIHRSNRLHTLVAQWTEDFNRQVLQPRGLLCKTQKSVENRGKHNIEESWLHIALTPEAISTLQQQPHIFSYNPFTDTATAVTGACACCFVCCGVQQVI